MDEHIAPSIPPESVILVPLGLSGAQSPNQPQRQLSLSTNTSFFGPWSSLGRLKVLMKRKANWSIPQRFRETCNRNGIIEIRSFIPEIGRPPISVASGLFNIFSRSANSFFPILEVTSLKTILSRCYEKDDDTAFGHSQELFYLILAIASLVAKRNEPVLASWADSYFRKATTRLDTTCDHSSRPANILLLQRTLLICVYLLLSPKSGDIWRHLGFAIRLFFDLSHRPSMDADKDHNLFCTLTRTLYCLERYVVS